MFGRENDLLQKNLDFFVDNVLAEIDLNDLLDCINIDEIQNYLIDSEYLVIKKSSSEYERLLDDAKDLVESNGYTILDDSDYEELNSFKSKYNELVNKIKQATRNVEEIFEIAEDL